MQWWDAKGDETGYVYRKQENKDYIPAEIAS